MDNRNIGVFKNMIYNIDQKIRKAIFLLNQHGYHTFTSDQGSANRLPKVGIVVDNISSLTNIISIIEKYNGNIWYEISNRWYKKNDTQEDEINFDNKINLDNLNKALNINYTNAYFIVFKAKTLEELNDFVKFIINSR